jgi:DNA-directed RNA polymerase beta' subunit
VSNDGLINLMMLKVYSGHLGNQVEFMEMNMHMAQNIIAETELRLLASTTSQIVSPSSNVPIISIYQDSLLGSYRITREGVKFSARDAMNLLMMYPNVNPATLFERSKKEDTNFELLSQDRKSTRLNSSH